MIITKEMLAESVVKSILAPLWNQYIQDKQAHEDCITFDEYVWEQLPELGQATFDVISDMYGDLDGAAELLEAK